MRQQEKSLKCKCTSKTCRFWPSISDISLFFFFLMVFRTVQITQVKRLEKLYQHLTEKRLTLFLDLNILLQRLS